MTDDCRIANDQLMAAIESGTPLDAAVRRHFSGCERCGRIMRNVLSLQQGLGAEPAGVAPPLPGVAAAVVEAARRRERLRIAFAAGLSLLAGLAVFVTALQFVPGLSPDMTVVIAVTVVTIAVPLAAVLLVRHLVRREDNPIRKRLGRGQLLSGVCLGIAERTGLPVGVLRLAFVVLFFFQGAGLWLYLILDVILPVHPDDREHLLRFRIRRAFRRWRQA